MMTTISRLGETGARLYWPASGNVVTGRLARLGSGDSGEWEHITADGQHRQVFGLPRDWDGREVEVTVEMIEAFA